MGNRTKALRVKTYRFEELEHRLLLSAINSTNDQSVKSKAIQTLDLSNAVFVENKGQWPDDSIKYAYNGKGINVGFTNMGPVLELLRAKPELDSSKSAPDMDRTRVSMTFDGALSVAPVGVDRSPTSFNYLVGEQSQHRSNVSGYEKMSYPGLYQGIDLLTWGQPTGMKYEFHVSPKTDWRKIRVTYNGTSGLSLGADGSLQIATPLGNLVEAAPILYQAVNGNRVPVAGQFVLLDSDTYGFAVTETYDSSRELVIDPNLAWATYLAGSGEDFGYGIALDASGNVYLTGSTQSAGWATADSYDPTFFGTPQDVDAFVAKLDPSGSNLLYATYFGGSSTAYGQGIAVDDAGNAYVTGYTYSKNFATAGAYNTTNNGSDDAFVAKLDPSGSSLLYATYLGGNISDRGFGIAVDAIGNAYVTGATYSAGWATVGAFDTTYNGDNGFGDLFVAKINASGSSLLYATYLGGSGDDFGYGIALDGSGNAYVTGFTYSAGWATAGAYDTSYNGGKDAFVAKLNDSGSSLLYATYFGGDNSDGATAIAVDKFGNAYITGIIYSFNLATAGAYDTLVRGADAFVAKFSTSGASLLYATYLGGSSSDYGYGIAVDGLGNAYVTGSTFSAGWATAGAYHTTHNDGSDAFLAKLNAAGSSLLYATYLGGADYDSGYAIAIDGAGNAYLTGETVSAGWATAQAYDPSYNGGGRDAFVLKFTSLVDLYPGDTNGDKKVDFADLVALAQNYGGSGKTRSQGDVTGDGNVDFKDLVTIAQNYTTSLPAAPLPASAPPLAAPIPAPPTSTQSRVVNPNPSTKIARPTPAKKLPPASVPPPHPVVAPPLQSNFNSHRRITDSVWSN